MKSLTNYYHYEFIWSYLEEFKEWFNDKYTIKFELEPFLLGDIESLCCGVSNGLLICFKLNAKQIEKIVDVDTSFIKKYIIFSINPLEPLTYQELEKIIFDYSSKMRMKVGIW